MNFLSGGFDFVQSVLSSNYLKIKDVEDNAFLNLMCKKSGIMASLHSTITQWRYLFSLEILKKDYCLKWLKNKFRQLW